VRAATSNAYKRLTWPLNSRLAAVHLGEFSTHHLLEDSNVLVLKESTGAWQHAVIRHISVLPAEGDADVEGRPGALVGHHSSTNHQDVGQGQRFLGSAPLEVGVVLAAAVELHGCLINEQQQQQQQQQQQGMRASVTSEVQMLQFLSLDVNR